MRNARPKTLAAEKKFREAIWLRDRGIDRATGKPLKRQGDDWNVGQVCHLKGRGAYPEFKYAIWNAFLMNAHFHRLSDARGGRLLKVIGDDANGVLEFVMTDKTGRVLWRRSSAPPDFGD